MSKNDESVTSDAVLILWGDPRRMRKSDMPGPILFEKALSLHSRLEDSEDTKGSSDPVLVLASALSWEMSGHVTQARDIYKEYLDHDNIYVQLLAGFLHAWTREVTIDELMRLRDVVNLLPFETLEERRFRNVNILRILTFSADGGQRGFAHSLANEVKPIIHGDLALALKWIARAWFEEGSNWWLHKMSRDELLVPWVHQGLDSDLHDQMEKLFLRSSQNIWQQSVSFGMVPGGRSAVVAELQAGWAGALWAIPRTRQAQALHMWASENSNDPTRIAALWLLGSGKDITSVFRRLEASFTQDSALQIVTDMNEGARVPNLRSWYEALEAIWDLLPYATLLQLVAQACNNLDQETSYAASQCRFIRSTAKRLGKNWLAIYQLLPGHQKALLLLDASAVWASELNLEIREVILSEFRNNVHESSHSWERAALLATLGEANDVSLRAAGDMNPLAIVNLVDYLAIDSATISSALSAQISASDKWLSEAEQGTYGFGSPHSAILRGLAMRLDALDERRRSAEQLLIRIWDSPALPVMERLSAINCVYDLVRDRSDVEIFPPIFVGNNWSGFDGAPSEVLPVAWLSVAPREFDWKEAGVQIVSASRDPDAHVRSLAAEIAVLRQKELSAQILDAVVLAALYDPEPSVLIPLLKPVIVRSLGPEAKTVFDRRIIKVAGSQIRWVREEIARFVRDCSVEGIEIGLELHDLLRNDRSWLVRRVFLDKELNS